MPFMQVFTGSMNDACSNETPSGMRTTPFRANDPVHHPNVLGKSAAAGLIPGGCADFLVGRTLGENLVPAVIAIAAGDVMEDHHPVADSETR